MKTECLEAPIVSENLIELDTFPELKFCQKNDEAIITNELKEKQIIPNLPRMTKQMAVDIMWVGTVFWVLFWVPRLLVF